MKPWYSLTAKDLPAGTRFEVVCPIVEAPFWTGLPRSEAFGWNVRDNTVSILNPFALRHFEIGGGPTDFKALVAAEATPNERTLLREAEAFYAGRDAVRGLERQALAEKYIADRVIRRVRIVGTGTFHYPDPRTEAILVHLHTAGVIDGRTDWGAVIPKPGAPALAKVRTTVDDILDGRV